MSQGPRVEAAAPPDAGPDGSEACTDAGPDGSEACTARIRVRAIRVAIGERDRQAARQRADRLARAARTDDFSALAAAYGDGAGATELGAAGVTLEAGAARQSALAPDVVRAARALGRGEVSRAIETPGAFWILQRIE